MPVFKDSQASGETALKGEPEKRGNSYRKIACRVGLADLVTLRIREVKMSHTCEICGQECYCDMDDCGGFPQPANCEHFRHHKESGGDGEYDIGLDDPEDEDY